MLGGYYRFYPGDYLRDTSGLTLIEHGAYNLLLHYYYSTEGCVLDEKPRLYRLCGAVTPEEQVAVDYVISTYFPSINGKLTNKRADAEIDGRHQFIEEQRRKGSLGGRPRKNPEESRGLAGEKPKPKPEESLPVPDPVPVPKDQSQNQSRVTRPGNGRFTPPTLDEVTEHVNSRGRRIDPIKFHAHYTSNGWKVGKNPMKSWRAAVVTWERSANQ
jgi:uncharacterized protein YdaU (DUF1376 family)